jgi:peptidoglycan/xylan/chitin deacetylase (PgdA/CDA1 family)
VSDALVLCYHALSEDWPADLSSTPRRFEAQVGLLARRGYRGVRFSELVAGGGAGGKRVAITFDDAYRSVGRLAKPILDRFGFPATVFAVSDFPGREGPMAWPGIDVWLDGPHEAELTPHTWEELRGLADDGWEIGSHTCTHPRLTELDDASLERELRSSRERCSAELGRPCVSIAYPYGDWDARVVSAAAAVGYEAGATLALNPPGRLEWPRVGVYNLDAWWRFRLKVSPNLRRLRSSRLG